MPGQTGLWDLPYSLGSDSVDTIDETMEALAERLDLMLGEGGTDTVQAAGIGTVTKRINYSRSYADAATTPRAFVVQKSSHVDTILFVDGEDDTGFNINLRTQTAGTLIRTFGWIVRPLP